MSKIFTFSLLLYFVSIAWGQPTPPPDFTMTSIDGITYNLYTELNARKPVILVFFSTSCGSCQEAIPTLEGIWKRDAQQGQLGWVWAFETGNASVQTIQQYMQSNGASYVVFRALQNPSILYPETGYNITYIPEFVMVCNVNEYKKVPYEVLAEAFKSCSQALSVVDIRKELSIKVLPTAVVVEFPEQKIGQDVSLIDVLGRVVATTRSRVFSDSVSLPKPKLPGVYIVSIRYQNGETVSRKVMILE